MLILISCHYIELIVSDIIKSSLFFALKHIERFSRSRSLTVVAIVIESQMSHLETGFEIYD